MAKGLVISNKEYRQMEGISSTELKKLMKKVMDLLLLGLNVTLRIWNTGIEKELL